MSNGARQVSRALHERKENGRQEAPAEAVDGADFWRWQAKGNALLRLREELRSVQAELRALEPEYDRDTKAFYARYGLDPARGDQIDPETLRIIRGRAAPPAPPAQPELVPAPPPPEPEPGPA